MIHPYDTPIQTPAPLIPFSSLQHLTFITGFRVYSYGNALYTFPEDLDEGVKISTPHPRLPAKLPSLSKSFLNGPSRQVEIYFEVWHSTQQKKRTIWESRGADCYRVLPLAWDSPPNSSLIQREYDLVFEEFFEP
ncbi:hypothetical protein E6O75_ATG07786 [Venturia nashicola]|uniref:Uncharacterized protein n=1 Tax=Venturia nashicola TaxID=86259 RepID=A0A4Z1PES6_9PEZI|nr:hypothetical protein E6O75_ATG07786 [Venturia nashicola]